ncbi:MAG: RNA methyltransferase [Bacteroidales bacterium]|nr:RNA methyltransferase [Bacteroidales bacterium]
MSSLSKNQLKALAAYRMQKRCDEEGVFVVEGEKMCHEALASEHKILVVCATADYLATMPNATVADDVYEVSSEQLERLSSLRTPNKVWMLVERKAENGKRKAESGERRTENGERRTENWGGVVLALDGLQDPGNMGTIMRTADWYGIRHIVCSRDTVSVYNPKVVQSTMGAIFRTRVEYVDLAEWIDEANKKGFATYGAMLDGRDYRTATLQGPAVLVVGNEGRGISAPVAARLHQRLTIPNVGGTCESLNAAVATAILVSSFF